METQVRLRSILSILSGRNCCPEDETLDTLKYLMGEFRPQNAEQAVELAREAIYNQHPVLRDVDPEAAGNTQSSVAAWAKRQERHYHDRIYISPIKQPDFPKQCADSSSGEYSDGYPQDEPDFIQDDDNCFE